MIKRHLRHKLLVFGSILFLESGTPAARMKKVPSNVVKNRSRELTSIFEAFTPYAGMDGRIERIWITEVATDGIHLVSQFCQGSNIFSSWKILPGLLIK